jgi:hypothetical protein
MKGLRQPTHLVTENPQFAINNLDNYRQFIHNSCQDILTKFVSVITEYMKFISEKISMKNKQYYNFIFERGIDMIIHVFTIIFYYTKNLDLTFYHSQKAYYFYIEFIEQISDDNVTFLQLSSKDAITFVYKKTIYEINHDYKRNMVELTNDEKSLLANLEMYISIYKNIIHFSITHSDFKYDNKIEYIISCCDKINIINDEMNKNKIKKNYLESIYLYTNLLAHKQIKTSIFFTIIIDFIKRIQVQNKKKITDDKQLRHNIYLHLNDLDQLSDLDQNINHLIFIE